MTDERLCKCGHVLSTHDRDTPSGPMCGMCKCALFEAAPSTDEGEARIRFVPFSAGSGTSSAPERRCKLCGHPEHGSAACSSVAGPPTRQYPVCLHCLGMLVYTDDSRKCQVLRAHALTASDYPALAAIWDNPEDEVAFDVSEEAKALIRAPLEERIRELEAERERLRSELKVSREYSYEERVRDTYRHLDLTRSRAEAAEAEVEKLREALENVRRVMHLPRAEDAANRAVDIATAALRPPSSTEGTDDEPTFDRLSMHRSEDWGTKEVEG